MPTLLRIKQVGQRLGIQRNTVYDRVRAGLLPAPIKYGARCSIWPENEIDACADAIIKGYGKDEMRALVRGLVEKRAA